ncbi:MAG: hypothetical protein RDU76_04435 [Candidatus Edwardsbacteria bacterium]|nr:hypothetical protein [Candidatus Edwardsbacteria bacterium]
MKAIFWLSITGIVLVVLLCIGLSLNGQYIFRNYDKQYKRYLTIQNGMTKEEVSKLFNKKPQKANNLKYKVGMDYSEVLSYAIPLETEPGDYIDVFYKSGKVVEKRAFSQGAFRFTNREILEHKKSVKKFAIRNIILYIFGLLSFTACIVITHKYGRSKSINAQIITGFFILTGFSITLFLGIANIFLFMHRLALMVGDKLF